MKLTKIIGVASAVAVIGLIAHALSPLHTDVPLAAHNHSAGALLMASMGGPSPALAIGHPWITKDEAAVYLLKQGGKWCLLVKSGTHACTIPSKDWAKSHVTINVHHAGPFDLFWTANGPMRYVVTEKGARTTHRVYGCYMFMSKSDLPNYVLTGRCVDGPVRLLGTYTA